LGGGQTHKSQGIIHGGMKYAVTGFSKAANAIADMPTLWSSCLKGEGEIDLKNVPLLSPRHYLWSPQSLSGKVAGYLASFAMRAKVAAISREEFPDIFKTDAFNGDVYAVPEIVLDVHALIRELAKPHQDAIFKINRIREDDIQLDDNGRMISLNLHPQGGSATEVKAQQYIFTAGAGNEVLFNRLRAKSVATQRRPLHMVYVKHPKPYSLFAHCLSMSSTPRLTITTHRAKDGGTVWYLGGYLAEAGVERDEVEQIGIAKTELQTLFPWLDFSDAQFGTCRIDRAEPLQSNGGRPDSFCAKVVNNMIAAWPTKLALAPKLADEILQILQQEQIKPKVFDVRELRACPMPPFAQPPWEMVN
ncbi:MAG TPA: FAD-dependent oxidoreductase, partial [Gammaproteobacteria bacterium]|nr:FAD-dependent oxidoreductase [Gammaproteobacteria bacterium]